MSRSVALVRFDDGTIYRACYNGTSDYLMPWLISEDELDKKFKSIYDFDDHNRCRHINVEEINDSENVEIFIDYGNGFMWRNCTASKSRLYVTSSLNFDDNYDFLNRDRIPCWVYDYFVNHGWDTTYISSRIV